jgi:hypothetical protein
MGPPNSAFPPELQPHEHSSSNPFHAGRSAREQRVEPDGENQKIPGSYYPNDDPALPSSPPGLDKESEQPSAPSFADMYPEALMSLNYIDVENSWLQMSMEQIGESSSSSPSASKRPSSPRPRRIYFYHRFQSHYGFTNFSPHPVTFQDKDYPTSEHLFQALKVG